MNSLTSTSGAPQSATRVRNTVSVTSSMGARTVNPSGRFFQKSKDSSLTKTGSGLSFWSMSQNFYHDLPVMDSFSDIFEDRFFQDVPSDWWVVLTDVVGST